MYFVIDIGSNTIRLVVYRVENNTIKPMLNKKYSVIPHCYSQCVEHRAFQ